MNNLMNDRKSFLEENEIMRIIKKEEINPTKTISNRDFNNITNLKSIGNFQFCKKDKKFTYREIPNILELKNLNLEKFVYLLNEKLHYYVKSEISIEKKDNRFYFYSRYNHTYKLQTASEFIFDGYVKLFLQVSK